MISKDRQYHFIGELTLSRSRVLKENLRPFDDKVNWLFLKDGYHLYSFVYEIENPVLAEYGKSFKAKLSFTTIEAVLNSLYLDHNYEVERGDESIGTVKLLSVIDGW